MHRLGLLLLASAACGSRDVPPVGIDASVEVPGRLPEVPATPLDWHVGAPLAAGLVTGRIYDDLAAHADDRMRDLVALGTRVIRIEIERSTSWDTYRTIVAAARHAGIEVLAIVSEHSLAPGAPRSLDGSLAEFDATFVPAYLAAVDETVAELGVQFVEVWNEPDNFSFAPMFTFTAGACTRLEGATRYALLAVRVFETMSERRARGEATPTLLAFGVSRQDDSCLRQALFDAAPIANHRAGYRPTHGLEDGLPTDILAMHGYGNLGVAPFETGYTYAGGTFADGIEELLAARFADGALIIRAMPIWYTEVGYSLTTIGGQDPGDRQAQSLAYVYEVLATHPAVTAALWYDYRDDEPGGSERCGVRNSVAMGLTVHPSYFAFQDAAARLDHVAPAGAIEVNGASLRGWAIDADGKPPTVELAIDGQIFATFADGPDPIEGACEIATSRRCPSVGFMASIPLPAGVHEIAARATDAAGNARVIDRVDVTWP